MPQIAVAKAFTLSENGERIKLDVGFHEVEDWVAEHWYTLLHLQKAEDKLPGKSATSTDPGVLSQALIAEQNKVATLETEVTRLQGLMKDMVERALRAEAALAEALGPQITFADTAPSEDPPKAVEPVESYIVRKKDSKFAVLRVAEDGTISDVVEDGLTRADADKKAAELRGA